VTVSQKAALSLLISIFLFAGFTVAAYMGLFNLIETQFYNPSITNSFTSKVKSDAAIIDTYLKKLEKQFKEILEERSVKASFIPNQSAEQINERARLFMNLFSDTTKLQSVRLVDSEGVRIHFSTLESDILRQDVQSVAYRNYNYRGDEIPYGKLEVSTRDTLKLTLDQKSECIIFSFPIFDTYEIYRGTALFTVSVAAITEELIGNKSINVSEHLSIVADPEGNGSGIVIGYAETNIDRLVSRIASIWHDDILTFRRLDSIDSGVVLALISAKTSQGIFFGRLLKESLFAFPQEMKALLLAAFFVTVYLSIFLLFNLRQDNMTIIQNRLKSLQISLIEQYYDHKGDIDFTHWSRELEQRRDEIRTELKRGIRKSKDKKHSEDIDNLIDKSWDELLKVIGGRTGQLTANIDEEKLQGILNRILASGNLQFQAGQNTLPVPVAQAPQGRSSGIENAEELEELTDADEVEELSDEAEELPDAVEELADADEAEELSDEAEELPGAVEELADADEAEELSDEAEELPDAVEGLADADEAEELSDEAEELPDAAEEEITSAEPLDEAEELIEVGQLPMPAKNFGIQPNTEVEELEAEPEDAPGKIIVKVSAPNIKDLSLNGQIEELEEIEDAPDTGLEGNTVKEAPLAGRAASKVSRAGNVPGGKKRSNIRLAFGEDDIPYIVESNGLELVDDDMVIEKMDNVNKPAELEGPGELPKNNSAVLENQGEEMEEQKERPADSDDADVVEELEELPAEELEALEDIEEGKEFSASAELTPDKGEDLAEIARRIEFDTPVTPQEDTREAIELLESNLEIVSPFSTIFSDEDAVEGNDKAGETGIAGQSGGISGTRGDSKKKRNN
jgi:hypothetical protein